MGEKGLKEKGRHARRRHSLLLLDTGPQAGSPPRLSAPALSVTQRRAGRCQVPAATTRAGPRHGRLASPHRAVPCRAGPDTRRQPGRAAPQMPQQRDGGARASPPPPQTPLWDRGRCGAVRCSPPLPSPRRGRRQHGPERGAAHAGGGGAAGQRPPRGAAPCGRHGTARLYPARLGSALPSPTRPCPAPLPPPGRSRPPRPPRRCSPVWPRAATAAAGQEDGGGARCRWRCRWRPGSRCRSALRLPPGPTLLPGVQAPPRAGAGGDREGAAQRGRRGGEALCERRGQPRSRPCLPGLWEPVRESCALCPRRQGPRLHLARPVLVRGPLTPPVPSRC